MMPFFRFGEKAPYHRAHLVRSSDELARLVQPRPSPSLCTCVLLEQIREPRVLNIWVDYQYDL